MTALRIGSAARRRSRWAPTLMAGLALGCGSTHENNRAEDPPSTASSLPLTQRAPIVFVSDRAEEGVEDIYVMAADGSGVERITEGGDFYVPTWSPDGEAIAFRQVTALSSGVGLLTLAEHTPVLLIDGEDPTFRYRPVAWPPDPEQLAYVSDRGADRLALWLLSRSGSQRQRLFPELDTAQTAVDWSRTAEPRAVYAAGISLADTDIWVAGPPENPEPTNLTRGRVLVPSNPRWSPDGTKIAFVGYALLPDGSVEGFGDHADGVDAPDAELFVIDVETQELTRLTDDPWEDGNPCWSPDGTALIFSSNRDGDTDLWLLPLDPALEARNLIDDADLPREDGMPDWNWGGR